MGLARFLALIVFAGGMAWSDDIAGTWRGESACEAKGTACRDETVVYRFSPIAGKPTIFLVSADKIVDGKHVNMGTLEFQYATERHELRCDYAQGIWRLKVAGAMIQGMLTRPDGTVFRRLNLRKDPS
jgi:hypothetical protein